MIRARTCPSCGLDYDRDVRTGLTYRDVWWMLWSYDDDPSTWRRKSRGVVLGKWHQIKRELWEEHLDGCVQNTGEEDPMKRVIKTPDQLLEDDGSWPRWPFLPLVRRTTKATECGYLVSGAGFTVFAGTFFNQEDNPKAIARYNNTTELLNAGWRVD